MPTAHIGLGANLPSTAGSPEATLAAATLRLESLGRLIARSSLYSTEPVGFAHQPRFFNAAVALETDLAPRVLLNHLLAIEHEFGRDRNASFRNGPRTLDLDILLFGDQIVAEPDLEITHPRLAARAFVLVPLAEIAPHAVDPISGCTVGQLLSALHADPSDQADAVVPFNLSSGAPIRALVMAAFLLPTAASSQTPTPPPPPAQSGSPPPAHPPQTPTTTVTVTAYRAPISELDSPATTRLLDEQDLQSTAGFTLDDELRQIPGLELFRRSSSLVANPTSQGMSLRGLGSTSASRTLVTDDDVPLNDPLGGWIHWQELPALTIRQVELVRGGASDLYGSSAIGGVVNVVPLKPTVDAVQLRSSYGGEQTWDEDLMAETVHGPWGLLFGVDTLGTDGYIQEAPTQRGPVDQPSNVHSQNGLLLADRKLGSLRLFLRGSGFNEDRNNGTPYQKNGTRLARYATGLDWNAPRQATFALRLYGTDERYHQTFSSISNLPKFGVATCTYRCGEIPTRFSQVPDNELGAAAHWSQPLGAGFLLLAGADTHDLRIWDREQTYGATAALTNLHDHQRDSAFYGEVMATHKAWTLTASARFDWFQNFDGQLLAFNGSTWSPAAKQPAEQSFPSFDPRIGLARKLSDHWAISASGFRAFRAATPNELYRSTQVGNQLTLPNGTLQAERATGWETGIAAEHSWGVVRASYFLTEVNRPISAVTTNPNSSPILLMRENLGQIESKGFSLDFELTPWKFLSLDGGYQYAHATVTRGTIATGRTDIGNWIPEVARNLATLNLRASHPKIGSLNLEGRLSGHQFDDDANANLLHGYFRLDAYASHDLGRRWQLFAAGENLLNRQIEVARTPTETLGQPRIARAGFLLRLGAPAK